MAEKIRQSNKPAKSTAKKTLVALLSVVCTLIVLLIGFILVKDSYFYSVAQNKVLQNDFSSAYKWAKRSSDEQADILVEYIQLRNDINNNYARLLSEFDAELVKDWNTRANLILEKFALCENIDSSIGEDLTAIAAKLNNINTIVNRYRQLKPDIYSLMDLFAEYSRLYTKDADGNNIIFTVSEETQKLNQWDSLNETLAEFAQSFEEGGEVYLLNYLIQEARGESALLRSAFNESGYGFDEKVRLEGDNTRTVSAIQNGSETLSLLEKERYESFMYAEICKALVENLGEYYVY